MWVNTVIFCCILAVTAVHKFNFRGVIKWAHNKRWLVENNRRSNRDFLSFWLDLYIFSAKLAQRQWTIPTLSRSKLFSSVEDSTIPPAFAQQVPLQYLRMSLLCHSLGSNSVGSTVTRNRHCLLTDTGCNTLRGVGKVKLQLDEKTSRH